MFGRRILMNLRSKRFLRREDGSAMVEAVLWLPIFLVIFGLMVDSALVFHGQSKVLRVVQDANRNMSIGRLDTDDDVETYITTRLAVYGITPSTATAVTDATTGLVTTTVVVPARQLQALGYFDALLNLEIPVVAQHMREDWNA